MQMQSNKKERENQGFGFHTRKLGTIAPGCTGRGREHKPQGQRKCVKLLKQGERVAPMKLAAARRLPPLPMI
jgi:hypothetical protein